MKKNVEPSYTPTQVCTILFVDIAGFSLCASRESPGPLSEYLCETLSAIVTTMRSYGAMAEKTLGDGAVCFFGDESGADGRTPPQMALECAIRIQQDSLKHCLEASAKSRPVCPLRIGINTAEVGVADIAAAGHHELTLVGHGANYAKRLEEACDNHSILCGSATYEALVSLPNFKSEFIRRVLKVKHYPDRDFTAYDWNPFRESPDLLQAVELAVREYLGLKRTEPRYKVAPEGEIFVTSQNSAGALVDFSRNGLGITLSEYYARGVTLRLNLESRDGNLSPSCKQRGLLPIEVEVCWARPKSDGESYLHGTTIRNLNANQKEDLFLFLQQILSGNEGIRVS